MGDSYRAGFLAAIFAIGALFEMSYLPLRAIIMGMNFHGRIVGTGLASAVVSSISACFVVLVLHKGLISIGIAMVAPMVISQGVIVPIICARALHLPSRKIVFDAWIKPVMCNIPFLGCLIIMSIQNELKVLIKIAVSISCGGIILLLLYYLIIIPVEMKEKLKERICKIVSRKNQGNF
jgi:hypothetical protein